MVSEWRASITMPRLLVRSDQWLAVIEAAVVVVVVKLLRMVKSVVLVDVGE